MSSEMKTADLQVHTPGPWTAVRRAWGSPEVEGGVDRRLWEVYGPHGLNVAGCTIHSRDEVDARLIAAAPDLLAGAKAILAARDGKASIDAIIQLRDAIAKAEGR